MRLVGIHGELSGTCYSLGTEPIPLGRSPANRVVLTTSLASRTHAELRRDGDGWMLHDLGSSNGTSVNGHRVRAHRLGPGDEITVGGEVFRFEASDLPEPSEMWPAGPD